MVLKDCQECRLVADIGNIGIVQIVQAANKGLRTTEKSDERGLVVWYETAPKTAALVGMQVASERGRGGIPYKLYSQILLSNVSLPVFWREQAAPEVSVLLHWRGS